MGGRGGSSHAGGEKGRPGRGQLTPFDPDRPKESRMEAIRQIMRDLHIDSKKATAFYHYFAQYFGGDYQDYTAGLKPKETAALSRALLHMPYFNGPIYRGMSFETEEKAQEFLQKVRIGRTFYFTDKNNLGDKVLSSWSSDEENARQYLELHRPSKKVGILFKMEDNKVAAGVRHISKFGIDENEVLSPAGHKMRPTSIEETYEKGKKVIIIHVKDIGWRKPDEWD